MPVTISGTSGITNVDGSAGTPAEKGSTSATAGMFFPAANTVAFSTSSTEAMRIDSSQNVGIGTNSPGSTLDVNGTIVSRCPAGGTGLLMRGRSSDNLSQVLGYDNGVTTLYGQLQFASTGGGVATLISNGATGYTNFYTNGSERARIDSSGTFFLGQTTNPATGTMVLKVPTGTGNGINAQITSNTGTSYPFSNYNASGTYVGGISCTSANTAFPTSSDYRLKENVTPMVGALDRISALKPVTYRWIINESDGEGFIAHELQEVIPQAVFGEKDDVDAEGKIQPQSVDYSRIVVHLVAAIQEQQAQIEELKAKVAALEAK